jgi:Cft2 family RNA processing exonuclease
VITPIPSGSSFGGACWRISYKLHTILYATQCAIESRYICDPFPYELYKAPNILITDSKYTKNLSVKKYVIENRFKDNMLTLVEKNKNIFIPCDSVNICIDLVIRIEKILDEFNNSKNKDNMQDSNRGDNSNGYKVLVCGYSSSEIIESVKSLVEFMGSSISQQFYTYNDNPFNLKYVKCIRDYKEYQEIKKSKNNKFIILSSFDSLDLGLSNKILPDILSNKDYFMLLVTYFEKNNTMKKLIKIFRNGGTSFPYRDIKRIVDQDSLSNFKNKILEILSNAEHKIDNHNIDKSVANNIEMVPKELNTVADLGLKKKLFAKSGYPMFSYAHKREMTEYGRV